MSISVQEPCGVCNLVGCESWWGVQAGGVCNLVGVCVQPGGVSNLVGCASWWGVNSPVSLRVLPSGMSVEG